MLLGFIDEPGCEIVGKSSSTGINDDKDDATEEAIKITNQKVV